MVNAPRSIPFGSRKRGPDPPPGSGLFRQDRDRRRSGRRSSQRDRNTVSVLATDSNAVIASNTIAATFGVGSNTGLDGVAFSPDGKHAYIAGTAIIGDLADILPGSFHARMVVIDTATNTVEHDVPIPRSMLMGVAVSPDGKHVYFVGEEQSRSGWSAGQYCRTASGVRYRHQQFPPNPCGGLPYGHHFHPCKAVRAALTPAMRFTSAHCATAN
jgi:hypothetical protein